LLVKLKEFDSQLDKEKSIPKNEFNLIIQLLNILNDTSFYHTSSINNDMLYPLEKIISNWPEDKIFPALDILRVVFLHPEGNERISNIIPFSNTKNIILKLISLTKSSYFNQLLALKTFSNALSKPTSASLVVNNIDEISECVIPLIGSENRLINLSAVSFFMNAIVYLNINSKSLDEDKEKKKYWNHCLELFFRMKKMLK